MYLLTFGAGQHGDPNCPGQSQFENTVCSLSTTPHRHDTCSSTSHSLVVREPNSRRMSCVAQYLIQRISDLANIVETARDRAATRSHHLVIIRTFLFPVILVVPHQFPGGRSKEKVS